MIMAAWKTWLRQWGPVVTWMAAIFLMSHQPKEAIPVYGVWDWLVKKGAHFMAYALLAGLAWRARRKEEHEAGKRPYLLPLTLSLLYALSDEAHQSFVPGRHPSLVDVGIDLLGAITTLGLLWGWARFGWDRTKPPV